MDNGCDLYGLVDLEEMLRTPAPDDDTPQRTEAAADAGRDPTLDPDMYADLDDLDEDDLLTLVACPALAALETPPPTPDAAIDNDSLYSPVYMAPRTTTEPEPEPEPVRVPTRTPGQGSQHPQGRGTTAAAEVPRRAVRGSGGFQYPTHAASNPRSSPVVPVGRARGPAPVTSRLQRGMFACVCGEPCVVGHRSAHPAPHPPKTCVCACAGQRYHYDGQQDVPARRIVQGAAMFVPQHAAPLPTPQPDMRGFSHGESPAPAANRAGRLFIGGTPTPVPTPGENGAMCA